MHSTSVERAEVGLTSLKEESSYSLLIVNVRVSVSSTRREYIYIFYLRYPDLATFRFLLVGETTLAGATAGLTIGVARIHPSEIMKIAVPVECWLVLFDKRKNDDYNISRIILSLV